MIIAATWDYRFCAQRMQLSRLIGLFILRPHDEQTRNASYKASIDSSEYQWGTYLELELVFLVVNIELVHQTFADNHAHCAHLMHGRSNMLLHAFDFVM